MAVTLLLTCGILGVGVWGWSLMKMKFDPVLLLPGDSYLREWLSLQSDFYPENGWTAEVYSETVSHGDLESIERLTTGFHRLEDQGTLREVHSWWSKLKTYAREEKISQTGEILPMGKIFRTSSH